MNQKEKRQKISELNDQIEALDGIVEMLDGYMGEIVSDGAESSMGHIIYLWNKEKDITIIDSAPLARINPQTGRLDDKISGMQVLFREDIDAEKTHSVAIPLTNSILVSVMTTIKTKLKAEQRKMDKQASKLMEIKKPG